MTQKKRIYPNRAMTIDNSGVPVVIEWHKFVIGSSFYIPTLVPEALEESIKKECKTRGIKIRSRFCFEGDTQGIRVWRTG